MVEAFGNLVDLVTISFAPFNGQLGHIMLQYTLDGTNSLTGIDASATFGNHKVPYACVKLGINTPIFPFGCTAYDESSVNGTFSTGLFTFTYGQTFPLWFELYSIAGTGFGPGRPTGLGTSTANFFNTATIDGLLLYDQNMNPLSAAPDITSALNITYQDLNTVPEHSSFGLLLCTTFSLFALPGLRLIGAMERW
jgi:hypothetical protein